MSCGFDNTHARRNDEIKHDAEHVTCDQGDAMDGVHDMVRALNERAHVQPTHAHQLRVRPPVGAELEIKQELVLSGDMRDDVSDDADNALGTPTHAHRIPLSPTLESL
jgi:hypothetical protein